MAQNNKKMKLKISTFVVVFFSGAAVYSQEIGNGFPTETTKDFSAALKSGVYNGYSSETVGITPDVSNPWQHLFAMRHYGTSNNYQLQIAASFQVNDRLFFRKIVAGDLSSSNTTWNEVATRGVNNFTGDQSVDGNVGIGTTSPKSRLTIKLGSTGVSINPGSSPYFGTLAFNRESATGEIFDPNGQAFQINNGGTDKNLHFQVYSGNGSQITNDALVISGINGNVGIGTANPNNMLDVNGTIHSKEVKVDLLKWPDFVFKKGYNLPSLEEVENHISKKGHLENIPSEEEVLKKGINLGEMNAKLLQKIEELTLYTIEQNKKINELQKENKRFTDIEKRLEQIEKAKK